MEEEGSQDYQVRSAQTWAGTAIFNYNCFFPFLAALQPVRSCHDSLGSRKELCHPSGVRLHVFPVLGPEFLQLNQEQEWKLSDNKVAQAGYS